MIRIIFVDDELNVLEGLRHTLRAYRQQWSMKFCQGPEQALAAMAREPFDVIVADFRMPGMDGAELLGRVRDLYPDTVRIVLCEQSEQTGILRAVETAHQFHSKPCDPDSLRATVTRSCLLGGRLRNPNLKALTSRMNSLPSLPDIYFELQEELRSEESSVDRVGALISRDVSMTAKVLQLVNSSFFGLRVHVADGMHAAALLGLNTLKPLVLTASIFRQLEESRVSKDFLEKVFAHSMAVAGKAKQIAKEEGLDPETVDNTFIVGTLHDVGKIVLADNFGHEYTTLCHQAWAQKVPISQLEIEEYSVSHADIGGYLLGLWGLPQEIVEAVAYHHSPAECGVDYFVPLTAIHVANGLTNTTHEQETDGDEISSFDLHYLTKIGCEDRLPRWQAIAEEQAALA